MRCSAPTPPDTLKAAIGSGASSISSSGIARSSMAKEYRRLRILWLKSDLLLPLDKGGKLRTWHLMRHLAARHEITYLAFADANEDEANLQGMHAVASLVETVPRS